MTRAFSGAAEVLHHEESVHDSDAELAPHETAAQFVANFTEAEAFVRATFNGIAAAERRLHVRIPSPRDYGPWADADDVVERMGREAWQYLVDKLELRRHMSIKAWEELDHRLRTGELPPITPESVAEFAEGYRLTAHDMQRAAVVEIFNWLRPHENDHVHKLKTNTELEIGHKVILSNCVGATWSGTGFDVSHYRTQHLLALENVFRQLDGRGITKTWQSELQTAIEKVSATGETSLFKYRACKNRNLHLEFKRLDLLARFNAIAGGKTLKPAHGVTKSQRSTKARRPAPDERSGVERGEGELAFYGTPPELASRVVKLAGIRYDDRVLEPSAGEGALALAAKEIGCREVVCVEIHPERADALRALEFAVVEADFLTMEPAPRFSVVVMNPPFHDRLDALHIDHALRFLRPGGALVAIASGSFPTRSDQLTIEVRGEVARRGGTITPLDGEPFAPATSVRCCLVHIPRTK